MEIIFALSALWSVSCIVGTLWATYHLWQDDERGMALACFGLGLPIMAFFAVMPWAFIIDAKSPDLATLKKRQWACTASHDETTMVLVGKVMVPQRRPICDAYSRTR